MCVGIFMRNVEYSVSFPGVKMPVSSSQLWSLPWTTPWCCTTSMPSRLIGPNKSLSQLGRNSWIISRSILQGDNKCAYIWMYMYAVLWMNLVTFIVRLKLLKQYLSLSYRCFIIAHDVPNHILKVSSGKTSSFRMAVRSVLSHCILHVGIVGFCWWSFLE